MTFNELVRSKKDARLYFKYIKNGKLDINLGNLKTLLIKLGYISHVEGDRFISLRKLPSVEELRKLIK